MSTMQLGPLQLMQRCNAMACNAEWRLQRKEKTVYAVRRFNHAMRYQSCLMKGGLV